MPTIVRDIAVSFPECPGFGFTTEPRYMVKPIEREGGFERVDPRWTQPLTFIVASQTGNRDASAIGDILTFWHAVGGQGIGFRFRDYTDYKSCQVQNTPSTTVAEQPFGIVGGGYQLVKEYSVGSSTMIRNIYRPIGATITVFNEFGVVQTDWSLDESTGLLTPGGSFTGTPGGWSGEFDLWVRFATDISIAITEGEESERIMSATFTLREKRPNAASVGWIGPIIGAGRLAPAAAPAVITGSGTGVVVGGGGGGGGGGGSTPPAAAVALGYTRQSLGPAILIDSNWFKFNFFGSAINNTVGGGQVVTNMDGSVTCTGYNGNKYGATICTSFYTRVGAPAHSWKGNAYDSDFLIEASIKFPEFSGVLAPESWPAFWALAIQALTGGPWNRYNLSQPVTFGRSPEIDVMEYDAFRTGRYGGQLHDWYGSPYQPQQGVICLTGGGAIITGADLSMYHTYAFSNKAATSMTRGVMTWYFDGTAVRTYSYDLYDSSLPPPPIVNRSAGSNIMVRQFSLILGCSNPRLPMTVQWANVWQDPAVSGNLTQ